MKLTIEMMIGSADRRPEAVDVPAEPKTPASQEVSSSIKALMTIRNSPRVSSTIGMRDQRKIGLRIALKTPKIRATTSMVSTFEVVSVLVRVMPLKIQVATARAAMLASRRRRKPMAAILPRVLGEPVRRTPGTDPECRRSADVAALRADGGVVAVPGLDHGVVGQGRAAGR